MFSARPLLCRPRANVLRFMSSTSPPTVTRVRKAWKAEDIDGGIYRDGVEEAAIDEATNESEYQRSMLKRVLGFQNASQSEINQVAMKSALKEFQRHETDTGSSEAQGKAF